MANLPAKESREVGDATEGEVVYTFTFEFFRKLSLIRTATGCAHA
jgi:hypothetical protein